MFPVRPCQEKLIEGNPKGEKTGLPKGGTLRRIDSARQAGDLCADPAEKEELMVKQMGPFWKGEARKKSKKEWMREV